jgi:uracil phosphoribosyltransferase
MLEFSNRQREDIDRIYVKLRDGMPMAAGMKKVIPKADVRYIISKEKQGTSTRVPITFWDEYDGYSNPLVWYADPINATGHTAIESLRFVRDHFKFDTALLSHIAANTLGIRNVQTSLGDFQSQGFMNYVHLSKLLDPKTGYMRDGLELIPDFGDKVWGTLGEDYSVHDIQDQVRSLSNTEAGQVELVKGTILHLVQVAGREEYASDRTASWITPNWISACMNWYCSMERMPFRSLTADQVQALIDDLFYRDFIRVERRPWKDSYARVYSLATDGISYASAVYIPILEEFGITRIIQKHYDFLIHLRPEEIIQNITDSVLA